MQQSLATLGRAADSYRDRRVWHGTGKSRIHGIVIKKAFVDVRVTKGFEVELAVITSTVHFILFT